jgi:hypothetical protein
MNRGIGHGEDLRAIAKGKPGWQAVVPPIQEMVHARREVIDPTGRFGDVGIGTDHAYFGVGNPPYWGFGVEASIERVGVIDDVRVEQHCSGDVLRH